MKRITSLFVIFCSPFLFLNLSLAQWEPEVRLTNNTHASETSFNNSWGLAATGELVHALWFDDRDGNYEIYYKRSTNQGKSWGTDTRLTNNTDESRYPSVSADGDILHLVWRDARDGNPEIYYKRSTDAGLTWGADKRLTADSGASLPPSMVISGSTVHVVWFDDRNGNYEIWYKSSPDNGSTWGADVQLTNNSFFSMQPTITAFGNDVHVAWHDNRDGNSGSEIYYKRSTDGGLTWEADKRLTSSTGESRYACLQVTPLVLHLVWNDQHTDAWKVYYKRSTDRGVSWSRDTLINSIYGLSEFPNMVVSNEIVHLVWFDSRNSDWEIYSKRSFDQGITWTDDTRLSTAPGTSWFPTIAASGYTVHAMWSDERDGNFEIYYTRDSTGNFVGLNTNTGEIPGKFSLHQNYPNPFNPVTKIMFDLPKPGNVTLKIYDVLGREAATLLDKNLTPGNYSVDWNASSYPSGVYFYTLNSGEYADSKKMILIK